MDDLYRELILKQYQRPRAARPRGARPQAAVRRRAGRIDLLGIPISAARRKYALLNLKALRGAVTGDATWPPTTGS